MSKRWLLLIYTVPTNPSRTRAYVWREIRRGGALLLRDGVAALPRAKDTLAWAEEAARAIIKGGGTATAASALFDAADERRLLQAFRRDRAREYEEIVESCEGLLAHIDREREHAVFTFEEVEELEADLDKIRRWYRAVQERDRFGTPAAKRAGSAIDDCAKRLAAFAERASEQELRERPALARARGRKLK